MSSDHFQSLSKVNNYTGSWIYKTPSTYTKEQIKKSKHQSADGGGCLKFYRPLELIGIYFEIKKKAQINNTRYPLF